MGSSNIIELLNCPTCVVLSINLGHIKNSSWRPRTEPGAARWEAWTLPPCYAGPYPRWSVLSFAAVSGRHSLLRTSRSMSGISEPRELLAPGQLSLQPRLDRDLPPGHRFLLPVPRSPALAAESLHQELLRHRHPHPCRRPTGTGLPQLHLVW